MKNSTVRDYEARILRVQLHIQKRLHERLDPERLAEVAAFSPYHFHRVFRGMTGESVKEYVRRLRLERAALHLKLGCRPVTAIAFDAGYDSPEAFARSFREMFNDSPSGYRRRRQAADISASFSEGPSGTRFAPLHSGGVKMDVKVVSIAPIKVAFIRNVGPYASCGKTWERLCTWAGAEGLMLPGVQFIGLCHDDPEITPPEKIRYDACITVGDDFAPSGEVRVQTISGGEYAVTTHIGPYERLNETYAALCGQWLPANEREPANSPCFEIYLNTPEDTEPEELITDIYLPLRSRGSLL